MSVGDRIRELRLSKHWNQKELAHKLGTSQSTVATWERGSNEVSALYRRKLCALFGVTPNELYGIEPPVLYHTDQRMVPVFDATCGNFINWEKGTYPPGKKILSLFS